MNEIKISIPYLPELSKNKRYADRRSKRKNPAHRKAQELIAYKFRRALASNPIPQKSKCYIEIIVWKPNLRGDASNYINPICDALKSCLSFDDNYFSGSWDWFVDKYNSRIDIGFKYETNSEKS